MTTPLSLLQRAVPALICALGFATSSMAAEPPSIDKVLAGGQRSDTNRARDVYRHPKETLAFFGVKPDSTVMEVFPGGNWYAEILAPYLADGGRYFALVSQRGKKGAEERFAKSPVYAKAKVAVFAPPNSVEGAPEGGADFVLTFRNVHNLLDDDLFDNYLKAFYSALKPGGVLGVVEHRAKVDAKMKSFIDTGYVTEAYVIKHAEMAGFKLDAKSEINANPKDTKDYPKGVWTLPPTLDLKDVDKAKYLAIGESDRMTLRFVKPAK
ncbi:MAG: class I SAM-dependent methyltransferase [Betaproteobacteria bacterium]|nr:class I SAM-dependent methyltransferase [Betaproteobacteria bacterium]